VRAGFICSEARSAGGLGSVEIPSLFRTYLRFGARVCGGPAIDRGFKTIDFLVFLDLMDLDSGARKMFFGS
jgi:putative hemolysin